MLSPKIFAITSEAKPQRYLKKTECAAFDVSEKMGPIRKQGSAEWCWAMVAADLIGYSQNLTPKNQVSAIDVAATELSSSHSQLDDIVATFPKAYKLSLGFELDDHFSGTNNSLSK